MGFYYFACILLLFHNNLIQAQKTEYKVCSYGEHTELCTQLQRGTSVVRCQHVQDSIECATRLVNGTADFGVFSAESALHLSVLEDQDNSFFKGLTIIKQLRHKNRNQNPVDFETVAVVHKSHNNGTSTNLKDKKLCHPGLNYGKSQKWSERVLKYFERYIVDPQCQINKTPTEIEIASLSKYFGDSCRPGIWSHDIKEDAQLKKKYNSLCKLCPKSNCQYDDSLSHNGPDRNHQMALNCLKSGGDVAYVSREDAEYFFNKEGSSTQFKYLCPNGTVEHILDNHNPCVWLRQPWKVIMSNQFGQMSPVELKHTINRWLTAAQNDPKGWESALSQILGLDDHIHRDATIESPSSYFENYLPEGVRQPQPVCNTEVSWCTINVDEKDKCNIIRAGGIVTGVQPIIKCRGPVQGGEVIDCLQDISINNSDFMGIDSNFGYIARKKYNLTSAMYFETDEEQYSQIVIVIHADSKIKNFEDLRHKQACLPEFGATPSIAFINLFKEKKFFKTSECRYGFLLANFFGKSCAPGADDQRHFLSRTAAPSTLCDLCLMNKEELNTQTNFTANISTSSNIDQGVPIGTCASNPSNKYYGNKGALRCLSEVGDVAILELQSLKIHAENLGLSEDSFRILCRNGSLANRSGFDVDDKCVLTTIVDGEIVVHRKAEKSKVSSIVNALNSLDLYFQRDPDFKMYNIFNKQKHLLFKDSTLGLVAATEDKLNDKVQEYIKLFENIEKCVGNAAIQISITMFTTMIFALTTYFLVY